VSGRNNFFDIFLVIMIVLNTIVLLHNITLESYGWVALNFLSGVFLIIGYENRRSENDQQ